jgi:PHD/YefM family antitoxin component YafN of YafNO toxin-antitoxin module
MEVFMPTVSAAEFIRNFGTFQRMVAREPIEVTSHGKIAGVYVSAEDAALLKRIRASRQAYHPWELPDELREALRKAEPGSESDGLDHLMDE